MHELWRTLGIRQHRVEHLSILRHEADMRQARLVPVKYDMADLMLALKEA